MRLIKWIVILALGWWGMKYMGISPRDLWQETREVLSDFSRDSKALVTGDVIQKTSEQLRTSMPSGVQEADTRGGPESSEARELAETRRQSMEAMKEAVDNGKGLSQAISSDGLKRKVLDNIRASGGD